MDVNDSRPEDHLKSLQRIAEDIPSGVSADVMKSILKVRQSEELFDSFNTLIISTINQTLERVWTDFEVSKKLSRLQELKNASPKEDAWRPTTGKADVKHIVADCLIKEKQELIKQIELIKQETELLKPYLNNFRDKTMKQLEEISLVEDVYKNNAAKVMNKLI